MEKAEERGEEQLGDVATQRAVLPIRDWEIPEHRKLMPVDLQKLIGAEIAILRVERHVWDVIQPPPPGVKVKRNGVRLKVTLASTFRQGHISTILTISSQNGDGMVGHQSPC